MSIRFSKGDKVVLKSGGPVMTVIGTVTSGETISEPWLEEGWQEGAVLCQWWDEGHKSSIPTHSRRSGCRRLRVDSSPGFPYVRGNRRAICRESSILRSPLTMLTEP